MTKKMLWVDLEMTGLDEKIDKILELAALITDYELNVLEEYSAVVYQPQDVLDGMNDWCKKTHGATGLTAAVPQGKPLEEVEKAVVALLNKHFQANERVVLAGNSVGNDKRFIDAYMPAFSKRLHYRLIDVSSFKEVFRNKWGIKVEKPDGHRASGDIHESVKELRAYLSYVKIPDAKA